MSLNTYDSSSGTLTNIASSSRIWTGTKEEWAALVQAGTAPRNCLVAITNDEEHASADEISYDNTESGLTAEDVQSAIDEIIFKGYDTDNVITINSTSYIDITSNGLLVLAVSNAETASSRCIFADILSPNGKVLTVTSGRTSEAWGAAQNSIPVFKGQKVRLSNSAYVGVGSAKFYPYY